MIIRIIAAAVAVIACGAPAFAEEPFCKARLNFEREFAEDISGGHFQVAEDPAATRRFRQSSTISAEFTIIEPHRTKEFGSGVAFLFCDASLQNVLRVAFADTKGMTRLNMAVTHSVEKNPDYKVLATRSALKISKKATGRVTFRKDAEGQLIIRVAGEEVVVSPGFDIRYLRVQIYCANGRVRFLDGDLVS